MEERDAVTRWVEGSGHRSRQAGWPRARARVLSCLVWRSLSSRHARHASRVKVGKSLIYLRGRGLNHELSGAPEDGLLESCG